MSLIAESYEEDNERSRAMGIAMGGYAVGILGKNIEESKRCKHVVFTVAGNQSYRPFP